MQAKRYFRTLTMLFVPILVMGCSNKPSSSEAQRLAEQIIGPCEYISIRPFTLLNGIPQGEGFYRVETRFILNFNSGKLYQEAVESTNKSYEELLGKIKMMEKLKQDTESKYGFDSLEALEKRWEELNTGYSYASVVLQEQGLSKEESDAYINALDFLRANTPNPGRLFNRNWKTISSISNQLLAACPRLNRQVYRDLFPSIFLSKEVDSTSYSTGKRYEYNWTLNMMKTDNGWQGVR